MVGYFVTVGDRHGFVTVVKALKLDGKWKPETVTNNNRVRGIIASTRVGEANEMMLGIELLSMEVDINSGIWSCRSSRKYTFAF
jgi:hypothetical protein